jgi:HAD superfamily hydrolase (TIGR01662 family)
MSSAAIFLDKDGTLLEDVPYNVDPDAMKLAPGAREALAIFADVGALIFVISNQGGVARGRFEIGALDDVEARLHELVASCGATLSGVYWCPHDTGMLLSAAREHDLALDRSWFIGDILDDVEAGRRAGCRTVLIDNGNETVWRRGPLREPHVVAADMHRAALTIREPMANREAAR